jgi:hypothetical protein
MNKRRLFLAVSAIFIALLMTGCKIVVSDDVYDDRGTVIIENNTNKRFEGAVWTDTKDLFDGTIRAGQSKTFHVYRNCTVYTDFETSDGHRSNPSGYVKKGRTLVLEL